MNQLLQDVRYAVRQLRNSPGFALTAVFTLALGIGANTAIFALVNTLMLRPLPFNNAQELVWIAPPPAKCGFSCETYSSDAFDAFRAQSRSYQDVTGYFAFSTADNVRLTGRGEPVPATGIGVIGNFFQVLGVRPAMGRLFTTDEARQGARPVVLLADAYWKRQFASDPDIVGKAIDLDGQQVTVVGVLPRSFDFGAVFSPGARVDLFMPFDLDNARDWGNIVTFIGRMKPGVSVAQTQAEARLIAPGLYYRVKFPDSRGSYKDKVIPVPLKEYVSGRLRRSLVVLWAAVGMILLIACVNLSNLLLARAAARGKEFAMRGALGASRGRIVRQLLTESLVLSFAGAFFGLGLAYGMVAWLARQGAIALPLLSSLRIDGAALGWTVLVAVCAAMFFGIVPGLRMADGNLHEALKDSGAGSGQSRKQGRIRSVLVVSEVALACVLLVGAGLLLRSFLHVLDVDLGFQPDHAAAIKVDYDDGSGNPGVTREAATAQRTAIFQQILSRVGAIPGVVAAGMVDFLPLEQNRAWGSLTPKGRTYRPGELPDSLVYMITPGYMRAMGMRLHGRDFTWEDGPKGEQVIIINQTAAQFLWPGGDAIGKIAWINGTEEHIVGVIDDVHESKVEGESGWQVYFPQAQQNPVAAQLVIRTSLPPGALAGSVLHALRDLNPKQPAAEFRPIRQIVDHAVSPRRFFMMLIAAFAALGLLLAALGIYGVISYSVTRQTQEIGIRMALGASRSSVVTMVLRVTLWQTLAGLALGIPAALAAGHLMANQLYAVGAYDPVVLAGATMVLGLCAATAGFIPARRAASIDPMRALRTD
jgi:predicted permease